MQGSLEEDYAALRKLRDASAALKEYFGDGEDPREWKGREEWRRDITKAVTVEDDRVTELNLSRCSSLAALPATIGELKALTTLNLSRCSSLAALPDAIGELGALTRLDLSNCEKFAALPPALGELGALTKLYLYRCSSLAALPAAMGELKALKALYLSECSSLAALPDAIGELGALTRLDLQKCTKLSRLPDSIGKLGSLTSLDLDDCSSLKYPPEEMRGNVHKTIGFCCLNLLEGSAVSAAEVKKSITDHVIVDPAHDERVDALVRKDPAFADIIKATKAKLDVDFAALRKLRDTSECVRDVLKKVWSSEDPASDPRKWRGITVADGRVTELDLSWCKSLDELPAAIGELKALTTLDLGGCPLTALPDAIGELRALTILNLKRCESLVALPAAIGELKALKELNLACCESLDELPAAIGELKALTELILYECSSLAGLPAAIGELKALTTLNLVGCPLTALPDAIGELKALTELNLRGCPLTALPESIGGLDALIKRTTPPYRGGLEFGSPNLVFPPGHMHDDDARVKRLLTNTTRFLDEGLRAADADDDAKADFLEIVKHAPFAARLGNAVEKDPALAKITNAEGVSAIELADHKCRRAMQKALFFLGRYEIADGAPEHRSATSLVVRALDYEAAEDYGKLFNEFDKDSNELMDADELKDLAAKLGTNIEVFKLAEGKSYTKDAFVAKCKHLFGKERKVVIKVFQVEEQWRNEKRGRDDQQLDARYVVQTIEAPDDDKFEGALRESRLFQEKRFGGNVGTRAIVMDAADRNLFQIYQSERPDLNAVRTLMQQVMECVQHLHEKKLVHGDIKMLNVVRLALDNRLRLIDLDAAAKMVKQSSPDISYVGSKFSSAVLPPECFVKLDTDQVAPFETYFKDDSELWEKVAPKVDKHGASYVVKTFSLTEDGAPKDVDGLPYEPVEASEARGKAVDYWSLGALLFQLVAGEPLVPSNRDDDCVDGNAMAALASWNEVAAKERLVAIKNPAARDLASKLLIADPLERATFDIEAELASHPFFKPPETGDDGAAQEKLDRIIEQQEKDSIKLDAIKKDTSAILKLSEENKFELQRTRQVLLKGVFEATEVTTPTTFVVLTEKLPEPFTQEEKTWIEENVVFKDDGSGVELCGKDVEWYGDLEARFKESMTVAEKGMDLAKQLARFEPPKASKALTPANFKSVIKRGIGRFFPTTKLYFYLVDELTGKPVEGDGYPIVIEEPAKELVQLLPVMQVGLHAMSAYNGVAGLVQMFGYPVPKVPEKWRKAAQGSVDLLKQESSVAAFGVVHKKSKSKDKESSDTVRGASLRELKEFFEANPEAKNYAGLRRIGDPNDGTAIWTKVKDEDLEATLEARAADRLAEDELRRESLIKNEQAPGAPSETVDRDATMATSQASLQVNAKPKELVDSDRALDLKPAADEPLPSQSHVDAKGENVIGDLDVIEGTDPKEVKAALEARARERRAETKRGEDDYATYLREKAAGDGASADAAGAPAAGSGPSAVWALSTSRREAGDPEALRRVEDRLTGIEEQLGAIRSIEAAMSRSLLRLSQ